jgi:deoxyribose-phosphate aldolase
MERALSTPAPPSARVKREELNLGNIAGRLEHRLQWDEVDARQLAEGCAFAGAAGLSAVLCRPEHVALAARELERSPVMVVTALGFHDPGSPRRSPSELAKEAGELTDRGANQVALIAAPALIPDAGIDLLVDQLNAVDQTVTPHGTTLRVLLNCTNMNDEEIARACERVATTGVALVQGGSFRGDRTPFSQIEIMRAALPRRILLKWTHPVRTIETMLLCITLGVDRFNGEPDKLLDSAARNLKVAPLCLPVPGVDF